MLWVYDYYKYFNSDVYRRQILIYIVGPCAERVNTFIILNYQLQMKEPLFSATF